MELRKPLSRLWRQLPLSGEPYLRTKVSLNESDLARIGGFADEPPLKRGVDAKRTEGFS